MRLLIVSDVHANIAALRSIREETDAVAFLGDAVDYGPCPVECVAWVREHAGFAVRGNHDHAVAFGVDPRCAPLYRDMALATWELHCRLVGHEDRAFLGELPLHAAFDFGGGRFYAVHAAPSDPLYSYLPPDISDADLEAEFAGIDADVILTGHTHGPVVRKLGGRLFVNPGSAGQPKGGDPRAAYAIWEDGEVSLKRAEYPIEETTRLLEAQPLPPAIIADLAHVLRTGEAPNRPAEGTT